jgi:hypothetical protein
VSHRLEESDQSNGVPVFMIVRMVAFSVTNCSLDLPAEVQMYWIRTGMLVMLVCRCENFCAMNLEQKFCAGLLSSSCVMFTFCVVLLDNGWNFRTIFFICCILFYSYWLYKRFLDIINFIVISAKCMCVFSLSLSVGISHIIKAILWHRWAVTATSSMIAVYHLQFDLFVFLNLVLWWQKWKCTVQDSWCMNCHWADCSLWCRYYRTSKHVFDHDVIRYIEHTTIVIIFLSLAVWSTLWS